MTTSHVLQEVYIAQASAAHQSPCSRRHRSTRQCSLTGCCRTWSRQSHAAPQVARGTSSRTLSRTQHLKELLLNPRENGFATLPRVSLGVSLIGKELLLAPATFPNLWIDEWSFDLLHDYTYCTTIPTARLYLPLLCIWLL